MTPALYWKIRALEGDAKRCHMALEQAEARLIAVYRKAKIDPQVAHTYVRNDQTQTMEKP